MRGGSVVSTLTGAFGHSLRETRLTALLGYVIASDPDPFLDLFGFRGLPQSVALETRHEEGRSDILVETTLGNGVVEAKVNAADPLGQSHRYPGRWVALLTHRIPPKPSKGRTRYVTWHQLAKVLAGTARSRSPWLSALSEDLLDYMKEHRMIPNRETVEVYAREINEVVTLELFLKAHLYGCKYQPGSRLAEALYFAPHLGAQVSSEHPGIRAGISYLARVESVDQVTTWAEFRDAARKARGAPWWNRHSELLKQLRYTWKWTDGQQRNFLLLGEPRLAFNPPLDKRALQAGKGFLSKRFFSFDQLFAAWGRTSPPTSY